MGVTDEPDVAGLFAPVAADDAVTGVLAEAKAALSQLDDPVDAELWGSDVIGALSSAGQEPAMSALARTLVPAAEAAATPDALAMLRVFAAVGSAELRAAADEAAARLAAKDVADAPWARQIGQPDVRDCWHYADTGGGQESVAMTFAYGLRDHTVSVLIDHGRGGGVKDIWVAKGAGLFATELVAGGDPRVVFEIIPSAQARDRLEQALALKECPEDTDQADDIAAHRALLQTRLTQLAAHSAELPPSMKGCTSSGTYNPSRSWRTALRTLRRPWRGGSPRGFPR
jgi:hypothetical protein